MSTSRIVSRRRVAINTLGCRLNQFESDSLASSFVRGKYELVSFKELADAYIINSCTVTSKSDAKTRNYLNRARRRNPEAKIFLTGCYVGVKDDNLCGLDKDGFYVVPNNKKYSLFSIVDSVLDSKDIDLSSIEDDSFGYYLGEHTTRTRHYLKIQDGCDELCSYCKVPFARGGARSRLASDIFSDIERMISLGSREIILTGINISAYSSSDNYNLETLLSRILSFSGDFRIHLSSIEPNNITSGLIELLSDRKMCKHLHIPLQSASNKVLSLMNRNYTREEYLGVIEEIRGINEDINITTDLILGFPGELDADFEETYSFVKDFSPSYIHTFKYSRREGTEAFSYGDQVDEVVKSARSSLIRSLSDSLNFEYRKRFLSRELSIIPEKELGNGFCSGYSDYYIRVNYDGASSLDGFKRVLVEEVTEHETCGKLVL